MKADFIFLLVVFSWNFLIKKLLYSIFYYKVHYNPDVSVLEILWKLITAEYDFYMYNLLKQSVVLITILQFSFKWPRKIAYVKKILLKSHLTPKTAIKENQRRQTSRCSTSQKESCQLNFAFSSNIKLYIILHHLNESKLWKWSILYRFL